jgi:hypothetical protein
VRLQLLGAAIGTLLTIPGLAGAGDPALLFEIRPSVPVVLENGGRRDALVTLEVTNRGDRRVRVERLSLTYFEGETAIGSTDPATPLFTRAGLLSDPRVEADSHDRWAGLCLAPPTSATSKIRFTFSLVGKKGVRTVRATQTLDVPLRVPVSPPELALPVTGTWRVTQGHTCDTNHRRGRLGGEFAWDLVAVSESGRTGAPGFETSHRNEESATFGRPVMSPVSGTVVSVTDGVDDNDAQQEFPRRSLVESARAPRWIFGNHLVIDGGNGAFVLIAHLKKGSIAVKAGDAVSEGAVIAQAGNSGNTMLPHVHVQVMDRADPADPDVSGIPAVFRDFVEVSVSGEGRQRDAVVRRVASGDPPEGAIVFPPDTGKAVP